MDSPKVPAASTPPYRRAVFAMAVLVGYTAFAVAVIVAFGDNGRGIALVAFGLLFLTVEIWSRARRRRTARKDA